MRLARCDYCGTMFSIRQVVPYWVHVETLSDGESEGIKRMTAATCMIMQLHSTAVAV